MGKNAWSKGCPKEQLEAPQNRLTGRTLLAKGFPKRTALLAKRCPKAMVADPQCSPAETMMVTKSLLRTIGNM